MRLSYHVMSSPIGLLFLVRSERGLRFLDYMDRKSLKRMIKDRTADVPEAEWEPSILALKPIVEQLDDYFTGIRHTFETPLDLPGSDFQRSVWKALQKIRFGTTRTYGQIAKAIHQPKAARAVGLANNQNPVPIIVPCHRVIGANGKLTGYGGGMHRKKWLLDHETRFAGKAIAPGELVATAGERGASRRSR